MTPGSFNGSTSNLQRWAQLVEQIAHADAAPTTAMLDQLDRGLVHANLINAWMEALGERRGEAGAAVSRNDAGPWIGDEGLPADVWDSVQKHGFAGAAKRHGTATTVGFARVALLNPAPLCQLRLDALADEVSEYWVQLLLAEGVRPEVVVVDAVRGRIIRVVPDVEEGPAGAATVAAHATVVDSPDALGGCGVVLANEPGRVRIQLVGLPQHLAGTDARCLLLDEHAYAGIVPHLIAGRRGLADTEFAVDWLAVRSQMDEPEATAAATVAMDGTCELAVEHSLQDHDLINACAIVAFGE